MSDATPKQLRWPMCLSDGDLSDLVRHIAPVVALGDDADLPEWLRPRDLPELSDAASYHLRLRRAFFRSATHGCA